MVLESLAAVAQILDLGVAVVEPQRWLRPTDVQLGRVGPNGVEMGGGTYASVGLKLGLASHRSPTQMPSVLILMHGGPWGITEDAATWMTRVRLGGWYRFHVPPGTYSMAALYIAAHTQQHIPPALLAVGESFSEVVIGDRRSVSLPGRAPTTAHVAAIAKTPESQKLFKIPRPQIAVGDGRSLSPPGRAPTTAHAAAIAKAPEPPRSFVIPEGALSEVYAAKDSLYQCVARRVAPPNDRCRNSQRGALVCDTHKELAVEAKVSERPTTPS
ncbi:hypothetical protein GCM10010172_72650 [Paractinoplanes ferrugineus]|uniref:Uncharacterized protein n=1 Tax=Paractinoplanes ferrugineus TaxID=113564 RepID=A0A919MGG0_9ACTN|nr:hypothetical protein [Actinoplanes ferrugineus]GIE11580.1 hypothetical protein Afe05nite_34200 [Actinoplanes ferrugineus]